MGLYHKAQARRHFYVCVQASCKLSPLHSHGGAGRTWGFNTKSKLKPADILMSVLKPPASYLPYTSKVALGTLGALTQSPSPQTYSRVQELCEGRGGRPGLPVLMSLMVSVDVKQH